jgi:hypothetical protein
MPGGDKTGPSGAGPMTGRAEGYCAGASVPGSVGPGRRGGSGGGGRGGRHGRRRRFYATGQARGQHVGGAQPDDAEGSGTATPVAATAPADTTTTTDLGEGNTIQNQVEQLATALEDAQKRIAELEQR